MSMLAVAVYSATDHYNTTDNFDKIIVLQYDKCIYLRDIV